MAGSITTLLRTVFPFKWATSYIKYLDIFLPSRVENIFLLNFPPLLMPIKKDLMLWQNSLFFWFGWCNIIKMNIMPRLLSHFQAIPIHIPGPFLQAINWAFVTFLWAQKPPRLAQSIMRLPKLLEGMA